MDDNILRFQIPVDDFVGVEVLDSRAELVHDDCGLF